MNLSHHTLFDSEEIYDMKTIKRSIAVATILGLCVSALPAYAAGNTGPSSSAAMDKLIQSELIRGSGQGVNAAYLNKRLHAFRPQYFTCVCPDWRKKHSLIRDRKRTTMRLRQAKYYNRSLVT